MGGKMLGLYAQLLPMFFEILLGIMPSISALARWTPASFGMAELFNLDY
jgi:hypothetical protein